MTKKEKLVYEMKSLMKTLEEYLKELDTGEIDETAYQRLGESIFSVLWEIRYYLGEDSVDSVYAVGIDPDIQGMDFEQKKFQVNGKRKAIGYTEPIASIDLVFNVTEEEVSIFCIRANFLIRRICDYERKGIDGCHTEDSASEWNHQ